jgi:WD40 repeat protein
MSGSGEYQASSNSTLTAWGTVKLWEVDTGRELRTLGNHSNYVDSVAFSPDGKLALSGSWDRTVKLWEVDTGREVRTLAGHSNQVTYVVFSPDGKFVLSGSRRILKVWDVVDGREVRSLQLSGAFRGLSPSGTRFLVIDNGPQFSVCSLSTGKELARMIHFNDGEWACLTPEGYFNGSANCALHLNVRLGTGNTVVGMEGEYYKHFHRPDLVEKALSGASIK